MGSGNTKQVGWTDSEERGHAHTELAWFPLVPAVILACQRSWPVCCLPSL